MAYSQELAAVDISANGYGGDGSNSTGVVILILVEMGSGYSSDLMFVSAY